MSQTGLENFDRTLQKTHLWLKDIGESDAIGPDRQRQYHALRSVLFALRDRLTVEEAFHLSAHLPILVRGIFWESYRPAGKPEKYRTRDEFLQRGQDPDAPTGVFRHWGLYHIAGERTMLLEGVEGGAKTEDLGYCINDFGELKYAGPMPPAGDPPHRYVFRLVALDIDRITQAPTMQIEEMWKAAEPHVLAVAGLTGTYGRG